MSNRGRGNSVNHQVQFKGFITALNASAEGKPLLPQVGSLFDSITRFAKPVRNVSEAERQQQAMGYECRTLLNDMKRRLPAHALLAIPQALRDLSQATEPLHVQHKLAREVQPVIAGLSAKLPRPAETQPMQA